MFLFSILAFTLYLPLKVWLRTSAEQHMLHLLDALEWRLSSQDMILGCTQLHCILSLGLAAWEDDDLASHLGGKLDRQMPQPSDAHDAHPIGRLDTVQGERWPHCSATAHQRSSISPVEAIGDLVERFRIPDRVAGKRANVVVVRSKLCLVFAIDIQPLT